MTTVPSSWPSFRRQTVNPPTSPGSGPAGQSGGGGELDNNAEDPAVISHSHPATEAYPSRTDISYASEPQAHYVLVSTRERETTELRSFRIVDGAVTEEPVQVVPAYAQAAR